MHPSKPSTSPLLRHDYMAIAVGFHPMGKATCYLVHESAKTDGKSTLPPIPSRRFLRAREPSAQPPTNPAYRDNGLHIVDLLLTIVTLGSCEIPGTLLMLHTNRP
jgi:hypothetical protein